jgi:hypothetical protein
LYDKIYLLDILSMLKMTLKIYTFVLRLTVGLTATDIIVGWPTSKKNYQDFKEGQANWPTSRRLY